MAIRVLSKEQREKLCSKEHATHSKETPVADIATPKIKTWDVKVSLLPIVYARHNESGTVILEDDCGEDMQLWVKAKTREHALREVKEWIDDLGGICFVSPADAAAEGNFDYVKRIAYSEETYPDLGPIEAEDAVNADVEREAREARSKETAVVDTK